MNEASNEVEANPIPWRDEDKNCPRKETNPSPRMDETNRNEEYNIEMYHNSWSSSRQGPRSVESSHDSCSSTEANHTPDSTEMEPKKYLLSSALNSRKIRKPLMEKKRRERINNSLEALKQILLKNRMALKEAGSRNGQRTAKLEKADILEMTVMHLEQLHRKLRLLEDQEVRENKVHPVNKLPWNEVVYCVAKDYPTHGGIVFQRKCVGVSKPAAPQSVWRPW